MDLTISTLTLEAFLLILVRTGCLMSTAPIFGHASVPVRLRVLLAACISVILFTTVDAGLPEYITVFGYTMLVLKEAVVGLSIGFVASLVMNILVMAGEFIDREIGFTMSTNFDITSGVMVTITAELYNKLVCLIILLSNLHYYILKALVQSFEVIPVGHVTLNIPHMYNSIVGFIVQYFSIGFRIAMPVFLGMTMLNVVLGVLAKSSPQMNMFSVGIQLKVMAGLLILSIAILFVPNITNYLMTRMQEMLNTFIGGM